MKVDLQGDRAHLRVKMEISWGAQPTRRGIFLATFGLSSESSRRQMEKLHRAGGLPSESPAGKESEWSSLEMKDFHEIA